MKSLTWNRLAATVAATALAASLTTVALAQAPAHDHGPSHEAAAHKLALDHGRKWATDDSLRQGMGRIRTLVEPRLAQAHAGTLSAAQFGDVAAQVEAEVGQIVARCKLTPEADAMLHIVIADIVQGSDAMAGKNPALQPTQGLLKVAQAVNDYGAHFDDPGFKPIRALH